MVTTRAAAGQRVRSRATNTTQNSRTGTTILVAAANHAAVLQYGVATARGAHTWARCGRRRRRMEGGRG